ncbi:MAG: hypothetical protein JRC86_12840 [Deltaproteobacteria bacterium]|nr:hypothetical protein [Deltaproteobacteria bacterium]
MKNYIIDWEPYETEFNGDKITMEIRPMKAWAMIALKPFLDDSNPKKKSETTKAYLDRISPEEKRCLEKDSLEIQKLASVIFPEHVQNLSGFEVNGAPPTNDMLAEETAFMDLTCGIIMQLISISGLSEDEEKNSAGPSATQKSGKKKSAK